MKAPLSRVAKVLVSVCWRCCLSLVLLLAAIASPACRPKLEPTSAPTPMPTPTPSLSGAETVARDFLRAWQESNYPSMYALLSPTAQASISMDKFVARYEAVADEVTLTHLTATVGAVQRVLTDTAQVSVTVTMDTQLVGQFQVDNVLELSYDGQLPSGRDGVPSWGLDWAPKAIFPLLVWDNLVHMFVHVPQRASIYDRWGQPLATERTIVELGVVPEQIQDEAKLLRVLSSLLGLSEQAVRSQYAQAGRPDWFMPVGKISPELFLANKDLLSSVPGITWREQYPRTYPQGDLAGQMIGYVGEISAAMLERLQGQGYRSGDVVGLSGMEAWGEAHLAGVRGATLAIISPDGRIVWTLAERAAQAGYHIHTTLDSSLQRALDNILGSRVGAIAVIDVRDGQVLALVSHPGYDPNILVTGTTDHKQALLSNPQRPFFDRAIAGTYPPGSTFKIVTMSAGMEELGLTQNDTYYCAGQWDGVADGFTRYCWIRTGHGTLNFFNGLVYSCDTVFWEVGKALDERDPNALSLYARAFGLGAPTGLNALYEAAGLIPDPAWKAANYSGAEQQWLPRDAVNMAIGQGDVLATPLQMANLVAAVANDGILYQPRLIQRLIPTDEGSPQEFPLQALARLPVSAANLQVVRLAMEGVVSYGTASRAFAGAAVRMAGKSGTAEAPPNEPHAWFVGYAPAHDPQIAVAVVLEHGGEGGTNAAPLFRRVVETYMALPRE